MSHVPHPLAREARALYAISHVHTGTPLFQILDPPLDEQLGDEQLGDEELGDE